MTARYCQWSFEDRIDLISILRFSGAFTPAPMLLEALCCFVGLSRLRKCPEGRQAGIEDIKGSKSSFSVLDLTPVASRKSFSVI